MGIAAFTVLEDRVPLQAIDLGRELQRRPRNRKSGDLTGREQEVVTLIAEGRTNSEIAESLGINEKTMHTHRANALRRLGFSGLAVRGDVMLTRYALRQGWVQL